MKIHESSREFIGIHQSSPKFEIVHGSSRKFSKFAIKKMGGGARALRVLIRVQGQTYPQALDTALSAGLGDKSYRRCSRAHAEYGIPHGFLETSFKGSGYGVKTAQKPAKSPFNTFSLGDMAVPLV